MAKLMQTMTDLDPKGFGIGLEVLPKKKKDIISYIISRILVPKEYSDFWTVALICFTSSTLIQWCWKILGEVENVWIQILS